jgi:hypothetical protein
VPVSGCRSHAARSSSSWRTWRGIISTAREWPRRRRRHRRPRHPHRQRPSLRRSRQPRGYRSASWILCQAGEPRLFRCCNRHWRGKTRQAMQGPGSRNPRKAPGPNPTRRHRRPSRPRACPKPRRCRCRGPARAPAPGHRGSAEDQLTPVRSPARIARRGWRPRPAGSVQDTAGYRRPEQILNAFFLPSGPGNRRVRRRDGGGIAWQ